jgi:hypothetical protein
VSFFAACSRYRDFPKLKCDRDVNDQCGSHVDKPVIERVTLQTFEKIFDGHRPVSLQIGFEPAGRLNPPAVLGFQIGFVVKDPRPM